MKKGRLFLIPVPLSVMPPESVLPRDVIARVVSLTHFVVENAKSARAFLKSVSPDIPLRDRHLAELNEHTPSGDLSRLLSPLLAGHDMGLLSEAGCPAVADPGGDLVALAHEARVTVVPMVGPSSILLALMASGLSGQNFAFCGYLPVKPAAREKRILELERESRRWQRTQIFIETPYRNRALFETLVRVCSPKTRLAIAADLTLPDESIAVHRCDAWRTLKMPPIDKRPAIFLLLA